MIQPQAIIDDLDHRFPGFRLDYVALESFYQRLVHFKTVDNHKKTIQAMCSVVLENYTGIMALTAASVGLSAEALSRNLFEIAGSTLYLLFNPALLKDFVDFGKYVNWQFVRSAGP